MSQTSPIPRWELTDITKQYPGVLANDHVSLALMPGQIHGLLGENGCGKSTLIRILSGVDQPSSGTIAKDGVAVTFGSPADARAAGIATVFQEFSLVPDLSVAENIALGRPLPRTAIRTINWRRVEAMASEVLSELGIRDEIDPAVPVRALSVAQQQLVEIAKAVSAKSETLILDEPTAALSEEEIVELHDLLRRLKGRGHSILYVSHRLDEVVQIVDVATILKDGKRVSGPDETPIAIGPIVTAMIGSEISEFYPPHRSSHQDVVLAVRGIGNEGHFADVSFDLHRGEILGIAGTMGSGRSSLLRALFGEYPPEKGTLELGGTPYRPSATDAAVQAGVGFVPENRKTHGLYFNFSGPQNASVAALEKICRGPFIDGRRERHVFAGLAEQLKLSRNASTAAIADLSGGNQQKIVLSRWLFADTEVFLLDEPTQGIDVGAKKSIYELLRQLTEAGKAILLVSSDFEELVAMSDNISILYDGRLSPPMPSSTMTARTLAVAASGGDVPGATGTAR